MVSEAPPFWWQEADWRAYALSPLSTLYGMIARHRLMNARREKVDLPVLCVGNLTVGGAGKTPVAIALAEQAKRMNLKPGFLSRGHGGSLSEPRLVDVDRDSARQVGDEPLLLAEHAPVAVTPNRAAGARILAGEGCDFAIMDDGFQSARIHIDFALLVVDTRRGVGNGHIIPGGPMRAPLIDQLRFADAVLKMGEGSAADMVIRRAARAGKPIFEATIRPRSRVEGKRLLAFAGIGNPEKFYDSIVEAGGIVGRTKSFGDHHAYSDDELQEMVAAADSNGLELITTAKDAVRLRAGSKIAKRVLERAQVLEIDIAFEIDHVPRMIIEGTLAAWRDRRIKA